MYDSCFSIGDSVSRRYDKECERTQRITSIGKYFIIRYTTTGSLLSSEANNSHAARRPIKQKTIGDTNAHNSL